MEYTLSSAAVARGFSSYLATLIGLRPTFFVVHAGRLNLDFLAAALVAALSCVLAVGTKHSSRFNIVITAINLIIIVFVICAGMPYAVGDYYTPFAPFGARGIFAAASVVFFSFIGFDTVATAAEEVILHTFAASATNSAGLRACSRRATCAIAEVAKEGELLLLQVKHPATDLPIGIVGSLLICGFLYALMCGAPPATLR